MVDLQRKNLICFRGPSERSLFRLRHRNLLGTIYRLYRPNILSFYFNFMTKSILGDRKVAINVLSSSHSTRLRTHVISLDQEISANLIRSSATLCQDLCYKQCRLISSQ